MKKITSLFLLSAVIVAGCQSVPANNLYSEDKISHGHGLAVDSADSNKLYIATHYGLLLFENEKELYRVGKSKDDYMGFSPHSTNSNIFFSSGHPSNGGNIGVQKSEDGGVTWKKISDGANGPVDFHAMAISPADPNILYGWYNNGLQRSLDGGKFWEMIPTSLSLVLQFVPDSQNEDIVFAASLEGLMRSDDQGLTWKNISQDLQNGIVITIAVHPLNSKKLLSFSQKLGLAQSNDGGITWQKINETFGDDVLLYIVFDKNNPDRVYTLTKNNILYRSIDSGNTWSKIR